MKLGQVMSFLDVGLVPEEYREEFQAKLAELRDAAPKVSFKDMRKVIEAEYGERVEDVFETFDPVPIAAASIGQVYKAKLHDGRDVAVKVQYPGVAQAVRSDMKNLGMILRLMKRVAPGLDPKAMGDEIRSRIDEELDYELEAQNQRTLARIYRGHPFIFVPEVVTSLSHERVIVSEFVAGRGFEELKQLPQAERDRLGEIVFRFYFGCMYRHHQFSGDPHPGNSLLLDDGRMAFLDFGLFKRIPPAVAEFELEIARLGDRRRRRGAHRAPARGRLHQGARATTRPTGILEQVHDMTWWYGVDDEVALTPEIATEIMIEMSDPRSSHFSKMRHETLPPDHLFGRRLEMLTLAVMSQLRAPRQLAPDRARVDLRRRAGHRARPPGGRVLRRAPAGGGAARRRLNRATVPPRPAGSRRRVSSSRWRRVFVAVLVLVARSPEEIQRAADGAGAWAPIAFVALCVGLTLAFFPFPLVAAAGGVLFGTLEGTLLSILGGSVGALLAFLVARHAASDAAQALVGERLRARAGRDRAARLRRGPLRADRPRRPARRRELRLRPDARRASARSPRRRSSGSRRARSPTPRSAARSAASTRPSRSSRSRRSWRWALLGLVLLRRDLGARRV